MSKVKEELLKEAEGIIKGKVDEKDRKESFSVCLSLLGAAYPSWPAWTIQR